MDLTKEVLYREALAMTQIFNGGVSFETLVNMPYPDYEIIKRITESIQAEKTDDGK